MIGEDVTGLALPEPDDDGGGQTAAPSGRPQPAGGGTYVGTLKAKKSPTAIGPGAIAIGKLSHGRD